MKKLLFFSVLFILVGTIFAGSPHPVYVQVRNADLSNPAIVDIDWVAYITARPGETLTEASTGCAFLVQGGALLSQVQCGTFASQWNAGETLHIDYTNVTNGQTGTFEAVLNTAGFQGFGPLFGAGDGCILVGGGTPGHGTGAGDGTPIDVSNITLDGNDVNPDVVVTGNPVAIVVDTYDDPQNAWTSPGTYFYSQVMQMTGATVGVPITIRLYFTGYPGIIPANVRVYVFNDGMWMELPVVAFGADWVEVVYTPTSKAKDDEIEILLGDETLPVTLTAFTAAYIQGEFVKLNWTTESESDLSGYKVYRSQSDIQNVDYISELIPAHNTAEPQQYIFEDREVEIGQTYNYWLEIVSQDGTSRFYDQHITITVEGGVAPVVEATKLLGNYPNPFNPDTKIAFDVKTGTTASLTIYNAKGQVVETTNWDEGHHVYPWDASRVGSGIYFYKLKSDSYSEVKKMIMIK